MHLHASKTPLSESGPGDKALQLAISHLLAVQALLNLHLGDLKQHEVYQIHVKCVSCNS